MNKNTKIYVTFFLIFTLSLGTILYKFIISKNYINDASNLNRTKVYKIITPTSLEEIIQALDYAKKHNLKISASGARHSMGGQAFYNNNLVINMKSFNKILNLNLEKKEITVEPGITWSDLQKILDKHNLSIKAMQSSNIFTVGGTISCNAHGMDHKNGSIGKSIKSLDILMADGSIKQISEKQNSELFKLVVGGYGLFGIIISATLNLTSNIMYKLETELVSYKDIPDILEDVLNDDSIALFFAHLSTSPTNILQEALIYKYHNTKTSRVKLLEKNPLFLLNLKRFVLNSTKVSASSKKIKWFLEKYFERMAQGQYISRNYAMSDSIEHTQPYLSSNTNILYEYFVPKTNLVEFISRAKIIIMQYKINLLNASLRYVPKQNMFLNYAPENMVALVLYINRSTSQAVNQKFSNLNKELAELALECSGTFYLTYKLDYTKNQVTRAYPKITEFFDLKRKYDDKELFINNLYKTYGT